MVINILVLFIGNTFFLPTHLDSIPNFQQFGDRQFGHRHAPRIFRAFHGGKRNQEFVEPPSFSIRFHQFLL